MYLESLQVPLDQSVRWHFDLMSDDNIIKTNGVKSSRLKMIPVLIDSWRERFFILSINCLHNFFWDVAQQKCLGMHATLSKCHVGLRFWTWSFWFWLLFDKYFIILVFVMSCQTNGTTHTHTHTPTQTQTHQNIISCFRCMISVCASKLCYHCLLSTSTIPCYLIGQPFYAREYNRL